MQLNREKINEFRAIYANEFGEQLLFDEAEILANMIVEFYWDLYSQPLSEHGTA